MYLHRPTHTHNILPLFLSLCVCAFASTCSYSVPIEKYIFFPNISIGSEIQKCASYPEMLPGLLVAAFSQTNIWKLSFNNSVSHRIYSTSRIVKIQAIQAGIRICNSCLHVYKIQKKTVFGFELFLFLIPAHDVYIQVHTHCMRFGLFQYNSLTIPAFGIQTELYNIKLFIQ